MPKAKTDDMVPGRSGQIDPMFHWETRIPHTVVLMLKSNEEDLILKACQSLYKFAHGGDLNQNLLIHYDVLILLLDHLEHTNRNVRRMSAMTLSELSANNSVQSALVSPENVVRLVRILRQDDDCVVDEMASRALLRLCADAAGKTMLLRSNAVHALTYRLASKDPDVLKNCLDALLAVLDSAEAVEAFVQSKGVPSALDLTASEYPVLQRLALSALEKAMSSADGRVHVRDVNGLEKLLAILENGTLDDLYQNTVAVLHGAVTDLDNILAIHDFGGLKKILNFVETTYSSEVLGQCAFLLAKMTAHAAVREILHELKMEPVILEHLLGSSYPSCKNGAARTIGHMCLKLESQETLVRLGVVQPLLTMTESPETYQAAVVALAAATRNHQLACRQVCSPQNLDRITGRLDIGDEEAISHAALTLRNVSDNEALRPVVAASCTPEKMVDCLESDSSVVLVSACSCLEVLCVSLTARRRVVDCGGTDLFLELLEHDDGMVRDACVRALQVVGKDFHATEQLCSGGAIGSLRRLRASDTLRIILEVDLSALYAIFGYLRPHHKLHDLFYDCGRQETCNVVPELADLLAEPLSITKTVFLINSGVCPYRSEDHLQMLAVESSNAPSNEEKPEENAKKNVKTSEVAKLPAETQAQVSDGESGLSGPSVTPTGASGNQGPQSQDTTSAPSPDAMPSQPPASQASPAQDLATQGAPSSQPGPESRSPQSQTPAPVPPALPVSAEPAKPADIYPAPDPRLASYVEQVHDKIKPLACDRAQSAALAQFVSARLGGPVAREELGTWSSEAHICYLKRRSGSNVVSMGDVERGGMRCRSLLFKFLADQIGLPCWLRRGAGGRYWASVLLRGSSDMAFMGAFLETVVDLMLEPGRLMSAETPEAMEYTTGFESH